MVGGRLAVGYLFRRLGSPVDHIQASVLCSYRHADAVAKISSKAHQEITKVEQARAGIEDKANKVMLPAR